VKVKLKVEDAVRIVQAGGYPLATPECIDKRWSISAFPRGPEISKRCSKTTPAWIDAATKVLNRSSKLPLLLEAPR
jgi:hypothetical protein